MDKQAFNALVDKKKKQKPISFQKMALIQEEISKINSYIDTLRAKEVELQPNFSPDSAQAAAEEPADDSIIYMLTVELCQLCASGDVVGVQILLDGGADPNSRDYDERTLLHIAAMNGRLSVTNLLLDYGADHTLVDREGKTPLDLAEEFANADIVKVLLGKTEKDGVLPDSFSANPVSNDTSPMSPNAPDFSSVPQPMVGSLIVIMVGLPARGKTYVAQQIRRYFQWNGLTCNIFSHQVYRKRVEKDLQNEGVPSGAVPNTADMEARVSLIIAKEMTRFIGKTGGVAILDGTQSTTARRSALLRALKSTHRIQPNRVIFVEVVNNDKVAIHKNILRAKDMFPNAPENFVQQYYNVLEQHEAVYKTLNPLNDSDLSYIRIEDNKNYSLNMISGWMPSRLAYMLHNLSHTPANLYLSRPGEYVDMLCGRIGGNSRLTERGRAYSVALFEYFKTEIAPQANLNVMTSCAKRATQTIHYFAEESSKLYGFSPVENAGNKAELNCHVSYFPTLDDINHGDCEGMLLSDVRKTMPNTLQSMSADPYYTAWPNGECIHQVFNARLEPHIHDIQASSAPVLVVSHLHLLQGLLSFFVTDENKVVAPQHAYQIDVPFECVIKIGLVGAKRTADIIDLSKHVDQVLARTNHDVTPSAEKQNLDYNAFRRYDKKPDV